LIKVVSASDGDDRLLAEYKKRGLRPYHVFIASSLALFRRYGALNLGVMTISMEEVGQRLATIALDETPALCSRRLEEVLGRLNEMLGLNSVLLLSTRGNVIEVKAGRDTCRICPKGVGELELPGDLCPYLGLIKGFLSTVKGVKLELVDPQEPVRKEGAYCVIRYAVSERT